jgi:hypothetical protein
VLSCLVTQYGGKSKGGEEGEREREKRVHSREPGSEKRDIFILWCHKIRSQNVLLEESGTTPCMRNGGGWGLGRNARRMNVCGLTYSGNGLTIWIRGMGTVKSVMRDILGELGKCYVFDFGRDVSYATIGGIGF